MANWVTHLMIADHLLNYYPRLDRKEFCVGNIAPDCNIENENWTSYTPSKVITHWMSGEKKVVSDCESFYREYVLYRLHILKDRKELSFLIGYYVHLLTDAAFQWFIRDPQRVEDAWKRIDEIDYLRIHAMEQERNWDTVKQIISREDRNKEISLFEANYLEENPTSGFITEILNLKHFPDYIDYLPHGAIVRKIGIMGHIPIRYEDTIPISITKEEYDNFVASTVELVINKLKDKLELNELNNSMEG